MSVRCVDCMNCERKDAHLYRCKARNRYMIRRDVEARELCGDYVKPSWVKEGGKR